MLWDYMSDGYMKIWLGWLEIMLELDMTVELVDIWQTDCVESA